MKLDVGFLYQHMASVYVHHPSNPDHPYINSSEYLANTFGCLFGLNINVLQTERHVLGLRGELLTSLEPGSLVCEGAQCGLFYGVKF